VQAELSMSDCRKTAERLAPYVDHLLPPSARTEVERHLTECPACRSAAQAETTARQVVRGTADALRRAPLPPGLRTRCEALARADAKRPANGWGRLLPVSLSALLVLFTALVLVSLATQRSNTLLAAQLTADHAKCFRLFADAESGSADAAQLEQMLRERYGWQMHVPPTSAADGVQLIGARRCLYADGTIPHVMYRVNGQDMSLFMLAGVSRRAADVTALGHRSHIWSRGDATYVLVAGPEGDISNAVRYVMQEAH
jgi:anti-sigma factor RsiW